MSTPDAPRPIILLGGDENALSIVRDFSHSGIPVFVVNRPNLPVAYSRWGRPVAVAGGAAAVEAWAQFLLGDASNDLAGAVLLACSDEAIELVIDHWQALAAKFLLEECPPEIRRRLLDKLSTYEIAREGGIPVPGFWRVASAREIQRVAAECRFPVILKPRLSHHSQKIGRKYLRADNRSELAAHYEALAGIGLDIVIMEFIPGGDDRLCSYYSYVDADGTPLVQFTKRHTRRYPTNLGRATWHETTWNPAAASLGEKFFRSAGLRGLGNVEFKFDERDGQLKIIEANARFTAANALVSRCGIDFARLAYDRLTGGSPSIPTEYATGMVLWFPLEDFLAFLELRRAGEIGWAEWLRSVRRTDLLPSFRWNDPLPGIVNLIQRARSLPRLLTRRPDAGATSRLGGENGTNRIILSRRDGAGAR
jgi:D-aspartate ligase